MYPPAELPLAVPIIVRVIERNATGTLSCAPPAAPPRAAPWRHRDTSPPRIHGTPIACVLGKAGCEIVDVRSTSTDSPTRTTGYPIKTPLRRFLSDCYEQFRSDNSGAVADYIPELLRADPAHFGVGLVTIDGHVYEVGDSRVPFTIQSVS